MSGCADHTQRVREEAGAVAIMVAICMTALCLVAAFVLDFGLVRFDKQSNKSAADLASAAGIRAIAGTDGRAKPFRGVCEALNYLKANQPEIAADLTGAWKTGSGTVVSGNPCANPTLLNQSCSPSDQGTWVWYDGTADSGDIKVDIKSGYRPASDPLFAAEEAALSGDVGDSSLGGCDHLAVIISEKEAPGFGALAMADGQKLSSRIRSVARAVVGDKSDAAVALLLLERNDCQVLKIEGSGPSIVVRGAGSRPALIHVDSLGNGDDCSSTNRIVDANFGPPAKIVAEDAETGDPIAPGVIGIVALSGAPGARPEYASDPYPSQVFAEGQPDGAPIGRALVGRSPVDKRYRLPVKGIVDAAPSRWTAPPAGYTVVTSCTNPTAAVQRLFVDCPTGATYSGSGATFAGSHIVFNGPVTVEGTATALRLPNAAEVYIKGSLTGPGLTVKAGLQVNNGVADATCTTRFNTNRTAASRIVVGSGGLKAEGSADLRLCQTAVILVGNSSGTCPIPSVDGLAPYDNLCRGTVETAGTAKVDWTAPNAIGFGATQAHYDQLEDLALWTETSAMSSLQGGGVLNLSGVFFLPNAEPFRVGGSGASDIASNAQFVTRKLHVAGNGRFDMRPSPDDVVTFPYFGDFYLVR